MRILVTRPGPDAEREAERLAVLGHEAVIAPLLVIEFAGDVPLQLDGAQALIATSRNALHALAAHPELNAALRLPLLAVGEGTARQGQELGFVDVTIGPGTGAELAALILDELKPEHGTLVHLAGETLAVDLKGALEKQGFVLHAPVLYRAVPVREFPAEAARLLKSGEIHGVILMSPRTARTFAALIGAASAVTQGPGPVCYCLSEAVAEAVSPLGFATRVATRPREEDVLALLDSEAASS